jgi:hypothetical protein
LKSATAIEKVVKVLTDVGAAGIRRHELRARTELPADVLSGVLRFLEERGELTQEAERRRESEGATFLRGRPATRYHYVANGEPYPEELPPAFDAPRDNAPTSAPVPHGIEGPAACVWCHKPLPVQLMGRPRQFCSSECRVMSAMAASRQLLLALQRPKDPYVFTAVARFAVAMDLRSRGFLVYGVETTHEIVAMRGLEVLRVGVYIANEAGIYFDGGDDTQVRAVVRRDGAIRYVGITFEDDADGESDDGAASDENDADVECSHCHRNPCQCDGY